MVDGYKLYRAGAPVQLGEALADSGEAVIRRIDGAPGRLAKLYHPSALDARRIEKIAALLCAPPADPSLGGRHRAFAWPEDAIVDGTGLAVGVVIPEVPGARSLTALSAPKLRRRKAGEIDWRFLHALAANLAHTLDALHAQGFVVGDLQPDNVLVDDRALVTLIDCDSWQIPDPREPGAPAFLCTVGAEGFTAPELIGKSFARTPRTRESDRFALAVLIFQLLLGRHPFAGEWIGGGEPPTRDQLIKAGDWPHRHGATMIPPKGATPLDALDPRLEALFRRSFEEGIGNPAARPDGRRWQEALCLALAELESCDLRPSHAYLPTRGACPWCARLSATGSDAFPEPETPIEPYRPLELAFERALARGDARMALELWREYDGLAALPALVPYRARMAEIGAALDAFDAWRDLYLAGLQSGAPDWPALARIWEGAPGLADRRLIAGEEIAGRPAEEIVAEAAERTLDIPLTPPDRLLTTPLEARRAGEARRAAAREAPAPSCEDASLDIPPMPTSLADPARRRPVGAPAIALSYEIDAGWAGLRPAALILTLQAPATLPALALIAEETGALLASVPAGRRRAGRVSVPFEQPAGRVAVRLEPAAAADAGRLSIHHPPVRRRRVMGAPSSPAGRPAPAR
ncbi:MAG: hypothetical protein RIB45_15100 [Marivibrio sp.]|uniref:helix-hairpin-helix domain-containing protein n=1 Tax=Marivibrio sp. TaxID=2039719 RepID=UPI0032EB6542